MKENGVDFTVYGKPEPAGSKRAFMRPGAKHPSIVDANPKARSFKGAVSSAAAEAWNGRELLRGGISLELTFYRTRPKGHFRSGKNAHLLKDDAPAHCATKPDALKLARGVEDALTGVIYLDDAQIVDEHLVKAWGFPARVEISVREMPLTPTEPRPR